MESLTQTLNDAKKSSIPVICYGVGSLGKKEFSQKFADTLVTAIKIGYRYFDNAGSYHTHEEMGYALKNSGVPREEFWIDTKIRPTDYKGQKYTDVLKEYLKELKIDYVDAFLVHNPFIKPDTCGYTTEEVWAQMEECVVAGLTKHIGISNFRPVDIERVIKVAKIIPVVNQMELNPYCFEHDTVAANAKYGIITQAYSPLAPISIQRNGGVGPLPPVLDEIAAKYKVTTAQVLLRWNFQLGFAFVSSSSNEERMKEQLTLGGFKLSEEDVKRITEVGAGHHQRFFWVGDFYTEV